MNKFIDWLEEKYFDFRYHVDTAGMIETFNMMPLSQNILHAKRYQGVRPRLFSKMCAQIPGGVKDKVFLDIGCGKGRACILAAENGAKKVYGVEICRLLAAQAQTNFNNYSEAKQRMIEFKVQASDVLNYSIPSDVELVFLYNPFDSKLLADFLKKIKKDRVDGNYIIICMNTIRSYVFLINGFIKVGGNYTSDHNKNFEFFKPQS